MNMLLAIIISFIITFFYASFFEWFLHKFLMHRPLFGMTYSFKAHALTHHRLFKSDKTYTLQCNHDKHTIPMAFWNGPVIISVALLPFLLISVLTGVWGILMGAGLAISCYYGIYEYFHW